VRALLEALNHATAHRQTLGHFNISEITALNAITAVVREVHLPVIVGLSEGERKFTRVDLLSSAVGTMHGMLPGVARVAQFSVFNRFKSV